MAKLDKLLARILGASSDANVFLCELWQLSLSLGFDQRVRGADHIVAMTRVKEFLILLPRSAKAKPDQVQPVRNMMATVVVTCGLGES
jgi:hypothetical protein